MCFLCVFHAFVMCFLLFFFVCFLHVLFFMCFFNMFFQCFFCFSRFVKFNGGIGQKQLAWLERQLQDASQKGQRVVAFGHVPMHPGEASSDCLLWNYKDVRENIYRCDSSFCWFTINNIVS